MILSKEDMAALNHFQSDSGGLALDALATIAWNYYSRQAVLSEGPALFQAQGAAKFAEFLKNLPKALRERQT